VFEVVLGEDVERAHGLAQGRAEPAARRFLHALRDRADDIADERALFGLRLPVDQRRIVVPMPHPLPAELVSFLDDARIVPADAAELVGLARTLAPKLHERALKAE